ncbi:MAG: cytochrome c biogenesis protein [Anaerolineae bacterium]
MSGKAESLTEEYDCAWPALACIELWFEGSRCHQIEEGVILKRLIMVALLAVAVQFVSFALSANGQGAVVEAVLFYSDTCPHCHEVISNVLPPLQERYGDSLSVELISVDTPEGYRLLMYVDDLARVPEEERGVPELLVGSTVVIGSLDIEERFPALIESYLAAGGVQTPGREELLSGLGAATPGVSPTDGAEATATAESLMPIYAAYLYQPGCEACERAEYDLRLLQDTYPQLIVERYSAVDEAALAEWLGDRYGLTEERRLVAPAFFVGDDCLLDKEVTFKRLEALISSYVPQGAPRIWEGWENDKLAAEQRVIERFRSFGLLTVFAAGLIDGINPCAFATLVFFISYLSVTGRSRGQVLGIGLSFTIAVFFTYLMIGFGLYRLLAEVTMLSVLGKVIYAATAAVCLAMAVISGRDALRARRGRSEAMTLKLPTRLRRQVNRAIRESLSLRATVAAALLAGVLVSTVELACTGQIYLPTLMFVAGRPELKASAAAALAIYNLAFVVPLVVVFAVAAYGVGSERLRLLLTRHTATVKLLTAALFLALAAWLVGFLL